MIMFFFFFFFSFFIFSFVYFSYGYSSFAYLLSLSVCVLCGGTWYFCSCLFRRLHVALFIYSFLIRRRSRDMYMRCAMIFYWKIVYEKKKKSFTYYVYSSYSFTFSFDFIFVWLHVRRLSAM